MDRPKVIPTVYLILVKGSKILLSRRYNTGFQDGQYSFPAGHPSCDNEALHHTMIREAEEEIGIKIDPRDLELVHVMHRRQTEPTNERRINLFFAVKKCKGKPRIMEPNKCDDLRWFELNSLPDNMIPYIKQAVNCFQRNEKYSEYGF